MKRLTVKHTYDENYDGVVNVEETPNATLRDSYHAICNRLGKCEDLINDILIKTQIIESGEDEKRFADWIRHELSYYGFVEPLT